MKSRLLHSLHYPVGADDRLLDATNIRFLQLMSDVKKILITIYDRYRDEYPFRSQQFGTLLDTTAPRGVPPGTTQHFYRLIHPDDVSFVMQTETQACRFLHELPIAERGDYLLVCEFRMKNCKGGYSRFTHQISVMPSDTDDEVRGLFISSELIDESPSRNSSCSYIVNLQNGKQYLLLGFINGYRPKRLTPRERRVMQLMAQGKDSPAIAKLLSISSHTVNNYRRRILEKTGTDSSTQAVLYCKSVGDL